MPIIVISLYPGRTKEQKDAFARAITDGAIQILKTKPEHIIVTYDEKQKKIGIWQEVHYDKSKRSATHWPRECLFGNKLL